MGGKIAEHLLESLGGSRDQTVARTYLGKEKTVRHEVGYGDTAEHMLESLNIVMMKDTSSRTVILPGGQQGPDCDPYSTPRSELNPACFQNRFSANVCRTFIARPRSSTDGCSGPGRRRGTARPRSMLSPTS